MAWGSRRLVVSAAAVVLVEGLILSGTAAQAGEVVRSFGDLRDRVRVGETVTATDRTGVATKGTLVSITDSVLTLETADGTKALQGGDLAKVQARRMGPLWNGAVIGAAIPAATIAIVGAGNNCDPAACVGAGALFAGIGAGIGVAIDALVKGNVTVFQEPGASKKARLTLGPMVGKTRKGVVASIRY